MQDKTVKKEKKNKKQTQPVAEVKRFNALPHEGLSKAQIDERIEQGLVNKTGKKYSKTYKSIFIGILIHKQRVGGFDTPKPRELPFGITAGFSFEILHCFFQRTDTRKIRG